MAKKHEFSQLKVMLGDKEVVPTNHMRIRFHLGYSCRHDGETLSTDHYHIFDLDTTITNHIISEAKQIAVRFQNGPLRKMTPENAKKKYPRGSVVKWEDIFPGRRTVVKEMSMDEIMEKAKNDPDFREELKRRLSA